MFEKYFKYRKKYKKLCDKFKSILPQYCQHTGKKIRWKFYLSKVNAKYDTKTGKCLSTTPVTLRATGYTDTFLDRYYGNKTYVYEAYLWSEKIRIGHRWGGSDIYY